MGKWETNIGNAIKNNSGGRIVIEDNGVRYNKKVSVVRQVVDGTVKQVWNSYVPKSYTLTVFNGGTSANHCSIPAHTTYRTQISASDVNEALDNGYTKLRVSYRFEAGNSTYWYDPGDFNTNGHIYAYACTKSPYEQNRYDNWHRSASTGTDEWEKSTEPILVSYFDGDLTLERNTYGELCVSNFDSDNFYTGFLYGSAYPVLRITAVFVK